MTASMGASATTCSRAASAATSLDGGGGTDTVSYLASLAGANFSSGAIGGSSFLVGAVTQIVAEAVTLTLNGVDVNLTLGTAANADAAGDTFLAVENLTGSLNHDWLTGTNASTTVIGRGGNDVIKGGAGDDILWGDDLGRHRDRRRHHLRRRGSGPVVRRRRQ